MNDASGCVAVDVHLWEQGAQEYSHQLLTFCLG